MKFIVDDFHATRTMGEWLMGGPDSSEPFIKRAKKRVETMWGVDRPILVLPPAERRVPTRTPERTRLKLPEWAFSAWLWCDLKIDPNPNSFVSGSHLVLLWWAEEFTGVQYGGQPCHPDISEAVWKEHAKDYSP